MVRRLLSFPSTLPYRDSLKITVQDKPANIANVDEQLMMNDGQGKKNKSQQRCWLLLAIGDDGH
jgi:hypothetical protein